jgi:hypothetical protein
MSQILAISLKDDMRRTLGESSSIRSGNVRKIYLIKRSKASRNILIINKRKIGQLGVPLEGRRGIRQGIILTRNNIGRGNNQSIQVIGRGGSIRQAVEEDYGDSDIIKGSISGSRGSSSSQRRINLITNNGTPNINRGSTNTEIISNRNIGISNTNTGRGVIINSNNVTDSDQTNNNETDSDQTNINDRGSSVEETNESGDGNGNGEDSSQGNNLDTTRGTIRGIINNATNTTEDEGTNQNITRGASGNENNTNGTSDDNEDSEDDNEEESSEENDENMGRGTSGKKQGNNTGGWNSGNNDRESSETGNNSGNSTGTRGSSGNNNQTINQINDTNIRGSQMNNISEDTGDNTGIINQDNSSINTSNQRGGRRIHKK